MGEASAAIFEVHQMMLEDDDYLDAIHNMIQTDILARIAVWELVEPCTVTKARIFDLSICTVSLGLKSSATMMEGQRECHAFRAEDQYLCQYRQCFRCGLCTGE